MIIDSLVEEPLISIRQIAELAAMTASPCISIYLPKYSPENDSIPFGLQLQTALQSAQQQLVAQQYSQDELPIGGLESFAKERRWEKKCFGLAIFCSRSWLRIFRISQLLSESVHVGNQFNVVPLLSSLTSHPRFAILALSEKHVRLLQCDRFETIETTLPSSLPQSVKEAGAFDQPDHDLENRSAAGSSPGSLRRIHFGTGTDEEKTEAYIGNFFRIIDREISHLYAEEKLPLIVAAVERELAIYRKVSRYPQLLQQSIQESPERISNSQLHKAALRLLDHVAAAEELHLLSQIAEGSLGTSLMNIPAIMEAVGLGRIRLLVLDKAAESSDQDGPLNGIAIETLRHGGEVKILTHQPLPSHCSALAILRY